MEVYYCSKDDDAAQRRGGGDSRCRESGRIAVVH